MRERAAQRFEGGCLLLLHPPSPFFCAPSATLLVMRLVPLLMSPAYEAAGFQCATFMLMSPLPPLPPLLVSPVALLVMLLVMLLLMLLLLLLPLVLVVICASDAADVSAAVSAAAAAAAAGTPVLTVHQLLQLSGGARGGPVPVSGSCAFGAQRRGSQEERMRRRAVLLYLSFRWACGLLFVEGGILCIKRAAYRGESREESSDSR